LEAIHKNMKKIVLTIKDSRKKNFLLELLKQFDFIEVQKTSSAQKSSSYNFLILQGFGKIEISMFHNFVTKHGKEVVSLMA